MKSKNIEITEMIDRLMQLEEDDPNEAKKVDKLFDYVIDYKKLNSKGEI